ncbi:hypothetical protein V6N13_080912 [Hibiscus sabdariffa]
MQVVNKRRRNSVIQNYMGKKGCSSRMKDDMGSHYSVLEEDHDMVEGRVEPAVNCESQGVRLLSREKELARNLIASEIVIVEDSHGATKEMSRTAFGIKEGLASGLEKNDVGNSSSVRNSTTCHNLIIEVSDVPSTGLAFLYFSLAMAKVRYWNVQGANDLGFYRSITSDMEWSTRFVVLCWLIWKRRCCLVLASGERYREDIILRGDRLLEECKRVRCTTQKGRGLDVAQVFYSVPPIEAASLVEKDLPESELNVGEATGIG